MCDLQVCRLEQSVYEEGRWGREGWGCHADSYRRGWSRWRPGRCGRWGRCAAAGRWCCRWWPPCAAPTPADRAACSPLPTATWGATSSVAVHTHTNTRRDRGGMLARPGARMQAHRADVQACAHHPLIHPHTWGVSCGKCMELHVIGFEFTVNFAQIYSHWLYSRGEKRCIRLVKHI